MWQRQTEPEDFAPQEAPEQRNRKVLIGFLLLCSLALVFAAGLPSALVPAALSKLLAYASFGAALVAAFCREPLFAVHLTRWDQAAALMGISLVVGLFVDPVAVGDFVGGLSTEGLPAAPAASEAPGMGAVPPGL